MALAGKLPRAYAHHEREGTDGDVMTKALSRELINWKRGLFGVSRVEDLPEMFRDEGWFEVDPTTHRKAPRVEELLSHRKYLQDERTTAAILMLAPFAVLLAVLAVWSVLVWIVAGFRKTPDAP